MGIGGLLLGLLARLPRLWTIMILSLSGWALLLAVLLIAIHWRTDLFQTMRLLADLP